MIVISNIQKDNTWNKARMSLLLEYVQCILQCKNGKMQLNYRKATLGKIAEYKEHFNI